jgi:hypothetical protein
MSLSILIWASAAVALIAVAMRHNEDLLFKHVAGFVLLCPLIYVAWACRAMKHLWNLVVWRRK